MQVKDYKNYYYNVYLKSNHWQFISNAARERVNFRCDGCFKKDTKLVVHHKTYENLGYEKCTDLEVLCKSCHLLRHFEGNNDND